MSPSILARAAIAAGLLVSGACAAYDAAAKTNIAMYWGQGYAQIPLIDVCTDPNIDIVNIGFINSFPQVRGAYPGSNHANACSGTTYMDPVYKNASKLLNSCSGVEEAINACHRRGKKVMLSLGGGAPTDYYLPNQDVAEWLAEFLLGAYGKPTAEWIAAGKPRPFGNAFVDGFDLDLEAEAGNMPGGKSELIYANYEFFGQYVKTHSSMLLSAAPQCIVPDARISPVLKKVAFDMVFTQFYNTWQCSAAKEVDDRKNKRTGTFTFDSWIKEIKASANPNTKFYIGLPAGPAGLPTHKEHYVSPLDADFLLRFYKGNENFGGVMLWEATVSVQNPTYGQSFGTWMKKSLDGTFSKDFHPVVSSSTLSSSTPTPTPTTLSTSSTPASSTMVSSSTPISSSVMSSSTPVSSSMVSSTPTPSTMVTSSSASSSAYATPSAESSSAYVTSSSASSSSSVHVPSSSSAVESSSVASSSSSVHESSSVYSEMPTESASSVQTVSSTMIEPSSIATISASASGSESVYVPLPTETASSVQSESSSVIEPSSIPSITATITASSVETVSSTLIEPSSVATISASESASSSVYVPSPTNTPASSDMYPTGAVSATSPEAVSSTSCSTSSGAYSTGASSSDIYSSSSESTPEAASSTPYAPPMEYSISFSAVYPSGVYSTASPAHPTETVSASKGMDYPAESSKTNAPSSTGYESVPSMTKKPEHSEYSTVPAGSTTSVVTTTYVDVCPTGLTTVTTTYVATVCTKCAKPTGSTDVPEGWTTSVYTASTVTVTITKPIVTATATHVPAYPSAAPSVAYPADYPAKPVSSGKPAYPAVPEASMPAYPAAPKPSKAAEYPSVPEASKGAEYPSVPEVSMPAYPVAPEASKAAEYPAMPEVSKAAEYPSAPIGSEYPKKPVEQVTSTVHMTLTKVAVPAYTPAPYPSAGGAPYIPAGPAKNGTSMYAPMPTGTGKPTMPSSYTPPAEFTGAASRAGAGFMMLVGVVGAVLVL